jgi:hypothetical protein
MYELKPDVILATDDGMNFWTGGLWATDLDVPLLIVNHATAEKPGMQAMARYLKAVFPGVDVEYVDVGYLYRSIANNGTEVAPVPKPRHPVDVLKAAGDQIDEARSLDL